jgi:type VI secretion system protein ImpG
MNEPIEAFYERELLFLEETTRPFAERYPANAKSLAPEAGRSVDPHLERLIEGFALVTGRIRYRIDSDFPELIESLLQILYPHLSLVVPSMAIAQVRVPAGTDLRRGWRVDKDTAARSSAFGARGENYRYRVGYPVTLWPVRLTAATWEGSAAGLGVQPPRGAAAVLRLQLACDDGLSWDDLPLDRLRFYLSGERRFIADLYDSLFNRCLGVVMRPADPGVAAAAVRLDAPACLHQVGLDVEEGLLPWPPEAFVGHRLLMEQFSFPPKFLFADLAGFAQIRGRGFGNAVEVLLFFSQAQDNLERSLSAQNLVLGCTPVVNVFPQSCEPIDVHHRHTEYRVVPDRLMPRSMEVYRIDSVRLLDHDTGNIRDVLPFFGSRFGEPPGPHPYYHVRRRDSVVEDVPGTEVYLSLADPAFDPGRMQREVVDVRAWCTNRNQPFKVQQAGDRLRLSAGGPGWLELLHKPTSTLRRGLGHAAYWRLVSQNALNHLSLIEGDGALEALRETLRLCDFSGPATGQLAAVNQQMVEGIQSVHSRPMMTRVRDRSAHTAQCRGMEVHVRFDEEKYSGTGVVLVASVLERFFALYTGINSFTRLLAGTTQAEGYLKTWPPRAGQDPLP